MKTQNHEHLRNPLAEKKKHRSTECIHNQLRYTDFKKVASQPQTHHNLPYIQ